MARKVSVPAGVRGLVLEDGQVLRFGDAPKVVSDAQFAKMAALVASGKVIDGGATSAASTAPSKSGDATPADPSLIVTTAADVTGLLSRPGLIVQRLADGSTTIWIEDGT